MFLPRMIAVSASAVLAGIIPGTVPPKPLPEQKCQSHSSYGGEQYAPERLAKLAKEAGFTKQDLVTAVAVALAESDGWSKAVLVNENCTTDRGLWQINDYWHPEVTEAQAFDPKRNAAVAFQIFIDSGDWTPWSTFENGMYKDHLDQAREAVRELNGA